MEGPTAISKDTAVEEHAVACSWWDGDGGWGSFSVSPKGTAVGSIRPGHFLRGWLAYIHPAPWANERQGASTTPLKFLIAKAGALQTICREGPILCSSPSQSHTWSCPKPWSVGLSPQNSSREWGILTGLSEEMNLLLTCSDHSNQCPTAVTISQGLPSASLLALSQSSQIFWRVLPHPIVVLFGT